LVVSWTVYVHTDADVELAKLPSTERQAIDNALVKLRARAAIGPEANQDRRGFRRAVKAAVERLMDVEAD
jgi:hypothetical protein